MKRITVLTCLGSSLVLAFGTSGAQAFAATPGFTISANNITMPSSGVGSIPITLTAVNGYTGTVIVTCTWPTPPAGVTEPYCEPPHSGPVSSYVLTADAPTVKASIPVTAFPEPVAASRLNRPALEGTAGLALAGVLMLGFGFRRQRARWFVLLLTAGTLVGLMGIGACAGGSMGGSTKMLTPGTYTYTVRAFDESVPQNSASTTVNVTVPPGIAVHQQ